MNIALWVVQALLAIMFILAGFPKTFQPLDMVAKRLAWVKDFPPAFTRFIGVSELLGAIGLILPALTHILPWLTGVAAIGLAIVMVGAVIFHIMRKEYSQIGFSIAILVLSIFVVYGRFVIVPIV